jgi:hypothetical protein
LLLDPATGINFSFDSSSNKAEIHTCEPQLLQANNANPDSKDARRPICGIPSGILLVQAEK